MRRRLFIQSTSASLVLSLVGCGGGGGGAVSAEPSNLASGSGFPIASAASSSVPGVSYPFGSRLTAYTSGIVPSNASSAQMDATIAGFYDAWKARGIVDVPAIPGGKALKFSNNYIAVSESMGYGMLITVVMAGHDPNARAIFDALLTTVRARPAYGIPSSGQFLMDWRLGPTGQPGDGWAALDGDLDIAMALLMADKQWGSTGSWNYKQEALNMIGAIKAFYMRPDGATTLSQGINNNRTSDYMIGHFRAFKKATGDGLWDLAIDKALSLAQRMQAIYSPNAGLIPDFVINVNTENSEPSHGFIGDGTPTEGDYYANAERDPWRFGTDYVLSGDDRAKNICNRMVGFIKADCGGDPAKVANGYHLDGSAMERRYPARAIVGPLLCGAMVDSANQDFLNSMWSWTVNNFITDYYDCELMLIPMMVASGNWWTP
jgi:hypothetical protein